MSKPIREGPCSLVDDSDSDSELDLLQEDQEEVTVLLMS